MLKCSNESYKDESPFVANAENAEVSFMYLGEQEYYLNAESAMTILLTS